MCFYLFYGMNSDIQYRIIVQKEQPGADRESPTILKEN